MMTWLGPRARVVATQYSLEIGHVSQPAGVYQDRWPASHSFVKKSRYFIIYVTTGIILSAGYVVN